MVTRHELLQFYNFQFTIHDYFPFVIYQTSFKILENDT